ncbi:MAG: PEP-CTERM sorting domain-containing protein [Acidobacteriota bacterium]
MTKNALLRGCAALSIWAGSALVMQAAPIIFTLESSSQITSSTTGVGNYIQYTDASGFVVTATAWYAPDAAGALTAAKLSRYSGGLGVCSETDRCSSPNHAVDNNGGKDFVLFTFSGYADPYKMTIGWSQTDADVQYWVGSLSNPSLQGLLIGNLASQGFTNFDVNEGSGNRTFDLLGGAGFSLLVSGQLDESNDYFKIQKLKLIPTDPPQEAPEPATIGLVGASMLGLVWARRKRR